MFEQMKIELWYIKDQQKHRASFHESYQNRDLTISTERLKGRQDERLTLIIKPAGELSLRKLFIKLPYSYEREQKIFVNGYQSWTDSREMNPEESFRRISRLTAPVFEKYQLMKYGDYTFHAYSGKRGEFHGYTYSYIRTEDEFELFGSLTERAGFTVIEHSMGNRSIVIGKDCEGLVIDKEYIPFQLYYSKGSEAEVFDGYFNAMGISKPAGKQLTGWTSWYHYYQNINRDIILENIYNFKKYKKNIDVFQIDDGYQTAVGDWLSIDTEKFPEGMKYIADRIKENGYLAGIWIAPFVCEAESETFQTKKDWILKDSYGKPVSAGSNWSGFYALDFYHPEVRAYIKQVFEVILDEWGYDMVKLDFLYAVCLLPREDKTRGQIMTEAMEFLRECVQDKKILGCGVPLGPAFGLVDYCRIGCDVSLAWDDKFYMRMLHRERISTRNAILNAIGRRQLNNRAFLNDPDVFLLREDNIRLNQNQKETLALVNHLFGSLLFTSDNLRNYTDRQFVIFDRTMQKSSRTIMKAECSRSGLVRIVYQEGDKDYLLLINMSRRQLSHMDSFQKIKYTVPPYGNRLVLLEKR